MATENKNEVLSEVEQLRKDLDTYQKLFATLKSGMLVEEWEPFREAQAKVFHGPSNLHLLFKHIDTQAAEIKRLRVSLESIALNAPQTKPELWACNRNYSIADNYYIVGQLAVAALKDGTP